MKLKLKLTKAEWDGAEVGIQRLYIEKDGEYVMDIDGLEDTTGLKNALNAERKNREDLAKQLKAWDKTGKKPEEISELIAKLEEDEAKRAEKAGEWDKLKAQLVESHKKELGKKDEELRKMRTSLEGYLIDSAATAVIAELKGVPQLLLPHIKIAARVKDTNGAYSVEIIDSNGTPRLKSTGEGMTIKELVEEMKQSEIFGRAFEATGTTGSGAGGGGNSSTMRATGNPWKKGTAAYNLTEQGRIYRDNPALAKQLMEEAKNAS